MPKVGGIGSFVTYTEKPEFDIVAAHKAAEIAGNGFSFIINWKEISKQEYDDFNIFVKRVHNVEEDVSLEAGFQ